MHYDISYDLYLKVTKAQSGIFWNLLKITGLVWVAQTQVFVFPKPKTIGDVTAKMMAW